MTFIHTRLPGVDDESFSGSLFFFDPYSLYFSNGFTDIIINGQLSELLQMTTGTPDIQRQEEGKYHENRK